MFDPDEDTERHTATFDSLEGAVAGVAGIVGDRSPLGDESDVFLKVLAALNESGYETDPDIKDGTHTIVVEMTDDGQITVNKIPTPEDS